MCTCLYVIYKQNKFPVVTLPSGASDRKVMWVQVPSPAPHETPA